MKFFKRRRGQVLFALVLTVLSVPLILLLASRSIASSQQAVHQERSIQADLAARGVISVAIARIAEDHKYGSSPESYRTVLDLPTSKGPALGELTFDPAVLDGSIQNVDGDGSVARGSRTCDAHCLRLVGVGRFQGVERRVEMLVASPPFDAVLATSGNFQSSGGLVIGSLPAGVSAQSFSEKDLLPAKVFSNGKGADALSIDGAATVVGTLSTAGKARIGAGISRERLTLLEDAKPEELPVVDIKSFDPTGKSGAVALAGNDFSKREPISGQVRWSGKTLTFRDGIDLKGGLLYVDGDLEIPAGGIRGQGGLVVTGNVKIVGGSDFVADNRAAVVAGGDVSISGPAGSYYQGLLYSGGSGGLSVSGLTVMGSLVSAGKTAAGDGAPMRVDQAKVIFDPKATEINVELGWSGYDAANGIVSETRDPVSGAVTRSSLRLAPIAVNGQVITDPKPKDFISLGVTNLTAGNFTLETPTAKYFPASATAAVQTALTAQGFSADPGREIAAAVGWVDGARIDLETILKPDPSGSKVQTDFKLDLNKFLKTNDRLRIVWAR